VLTSTSEEGSGIDWKEEGSGIDWKLMVSTVPSLQVIVSSL
jgi:hypothetical protein